MAKGKKRYLRRRRRFFEVFFVVPMIFFARNFWPRPALPYREGGGVSQQPFSSRQPFLCPVCPPLQRVGYAVGIVPPFAPCSLSHVSFQRNSLLLSPSDKQALNPPQHDPFPGFRPPSELNPTTLVAHYPFGLRRRPLFSSTAPPQPPRCGGPIGPCGPSYPRRCSRGPSGVFNGRRSQCPPEQTPLCCFLLFSSPCLLSVL